MGRNERDVFWICVVMSMALALVAVALALPRGAGALEFDYQGVYVAIFAALVTLLIGWQIFTAIDLEKKVEKSSTKVDKTLKEIENLKEKVETERENAEFFNLGIYYALSAAANYTQMRLGKPTDNRKKANAIAHSYCMALRSLAYALECQKDYYKIEALVALDMSIVDIADRRLFGELSQYAKDAFKPEDHTECDEIYKRIIANASALGSENIDIINKVRIKRQSLQEK